MAGVVSLDIVNGTAEAIAAAWPDATIYADKVPSGAVFPCFFIKILSCSILQELDDRCLTAWSLAVQYIPAENTMRADQQAAVHSIEEELYLRLRHISCGEYVIRGMNMSSGTIDDVLTFYVTFRAWQSYPEDGGAATMQKLLRETEVR